MHLQETNGVTFLYTMSSGKALCLCANVSECAQMSVISFRGKFPFGLFPSGCALELL